MIGLAQAGYFSSSARVRGAVVADVLRTILAELGRISSAPVDEAELAAAKTSATGSFLLEMQLQQNLADKLASMKLFNLPRDYLDGYTAHVGAVDASQILASAKKWMDPDHAVVVVIGNAAAIGPELAKIGPFELVDALGVPVPAKSTVDKSAPARPAPAQTAPAR